MTEAFIENQENVTNSAMATAQEIENNSPAEDAQVATPPTLMEFSEQDEKSRSNGSVEGAVDNISMLMDVNLQFTVELGRTQMPVRQILELQNGSVVELDRIAGEAVDVYINEHLMARGEVVVVDDKFGVRITELISPTKGK